MNTVVLDANAIAHGDWHLESVAWQVLAHETRSHRCRLVVPEVVVREVVGTFGRAVDAAAHSLRKATAEVRSLVPNHPAGLTVKVASSLEAYERRLRDELSTSGALVVDPPNVDLLLLTDRAIARTPPFNEVGSGFRDALVWEHVLSEIRSGHSHVFLVSRDKAFRDARSDALHPLLEQEARDAVPVDRGAHTRILSSQVTLVPSLKQLVRAIGVSRPEVHAEVLALVAREQAAIGSLLREAVLAADVDADPEEAEVAVEDAGTPDLITVELVSVADSEEAPVAYVELQADVDIEVQVGLWREMAETVLKSGSISVSATGIYDLARGELDNVTVGTLHVDVEDEVLELRRIHGL